MANYNNYIEIFNSLDEFINTIGKRGLNPSFSSFSRGSDIGGNVGISETTTKDFAEACELARCGDSANLEKITNFRESVKNGSGQIEKTTYRAGVVGAVPIVPNYLRGVPANMMQARKAARSSNIVNLVVNCGYSANISSSQIIKTGANIAAVVKNYELNNIRVNLYACSYAVCAPKLPQFLGVAVKIKDAGAPLNMLKIAFPLINPSFLRRLVFRFRETCPALIYKKWSGYMGYSCNIDNKTFLNIPPYKFLNLKDCLNLDAVEMFKLLDKQK